MQASLRFFPEFSVGLFLKMDRWLDHFLTLNHPSLSLMSELRSVSKSILISYPMKKGNMHFVRRIWTIIRRTKSFSPQNLQIISTDVPNFSRCYLSLRGSVNVFTLILRFFTFTQEFSNTFVWRTTTSSSWTVLPFLKFSRLFDIYLFKPKYFLWG